MTNTSKPDNKPLWPLVALNTALLIVIAAIFWFVMMPAAPEPSASSEGNVIPPFGMQAYNEEESFGSADLQGDLFVLNIFASWCKPCEAEFPALHALKKETGIPLYGIALQDDPQKLEKFLERLGNPFEKIGLDHGGLMLSGLGVKGVPTTFLVDGDLNILWTHEAPITEEQVKSELLPLIEKLSL